MPGAASLQVHDPELPGLERRIGAQQLDDRLRIRSLLQLLIDEHLILVGAVDARPDRRRLPFPGTTTACTPIRN